MTHAGILRKDWQKLPLAPLHRLTLCRDWRGKDWEAKKNNVGTDECEGLFSSASSVKDYNFKFSNCIIYCLFGIGLQWWLRGCAKAPFARAGRSEGSNVMSNITNYFYYCDHLRWIMINSVLFYVTCPCQTFHPHTHPRLTEPTCTHTKKNGKGHWMSIIN